MLYTVTLSDLEFFAFHGIYEEEKVLGGKFTVDMAIMFEIAPDDRIDALEKAANYELAYAIISKQMAIPRPLIESVAQSIFRDIRNAFTNAFSISVSITKHNPAGLFKSGSAKVTFTS